MGGKTHGMYNTPIYNSWRAMMHRCYKKDDMAYDNYGGRGITVCARWHDVVMFYQDMIATHKKGLQLDRFPDNNGNYEPDNIRWATPSENARNKRNNTLITCNGVTKCLAEWAEETGIARDTLMYRIKKMGWPIEKAFTEPLRNSKNVGECV